MRKTVIAGNWKMFKDVTESADLVNGLKAALKQIPSNVTVVICPPFTSLSAASALLKETQIRLGAQNMSEHDEGAYTGEISWKMLKSIGCEFVIVGHSERRQYFGETDELINRKARKGLANGLRPIICVGETLQEREGGITAKVVATQVKGILQGIAASEMEKVILAYEPVWAIGTGKTATPAQAEEVHLMIRKLVSSLMGDAVGRDLVIQYGGSVKPDNAAELLSQNDIDGALVGGACLKADSFSAIVAAARQ
jgi:triosephosphate isomerase (TIM)